MDTTPRHLFVYGTLRPGEERWQHLAPYVVDGGRPDTTIGSLFDTGVGYPAALFGGEGVIHGHVFAIRADTYEQCLTVLDEIEGAVAGVYRRVRVSTGAGVDVWTYEYGGGLELTPIDSGDWLAGDR